MKLIAFSEVLHPTDFSEGDAGAFAHALRISEAAQGELSLLHVNRAHETSRWSDFPSVRRMLEGWHRPLEADPAAPAEKSGFRVKKVQRQSSDPSHAIADYAQHHDPDLVVLSTHQRQGFDRLLHPSMADAIASAVHTMALFVPRQCQGFISTETGRPRLATVLLPVDRSPNPQPAVEAALKLADLLQIPESRFCFLHAGKPGHFPALNLPDRPGRVFERDTWDGSPVERILQVSEAQDVDLIVMATRGSHGVMDALRGSTTQRVIREAKCPVLAVPA